MSDRPPLTYTCRGSCGCCTLVAEYQAATPAPTEDAIASVRHSMGDHSECSHVLPAPTEDATLEAVPLERPPLKGMLVRDCTCKRAHDHYEELGT